MAFKGLSLKLSALIIVGFIIVVTALGTLMDVKTSIIVAAVGMMISGGIGLKIDSFAFIKLSENMPRSKKINSLILYMNCLLVFLGIVMIFQQF